MLKVLYVNNSTTMGGAAQSLMDIISQCGKVIQPVIVIPQKGIIEEYLTKLNVIHYIVPFTNGYSGIGTGSESDEDNNFFDNYRAALEVKKIAEEHNIQIIHTNSSTANVGAMAALMLGIPHIWHLRELMEEDFNSEFWDKELKCDLLKCANEIISISECVQRSYIEKYGVESVCIYNGLNIKRFYKELDNSIENKVNNFVLVGAISAEKGQLDAIKAVKYLVETGSRGIKLYIVGTGNFQYVWLLKKYISQYNLESNIQISPFRSDLSKIRSQCLFSITTSKMEALGRVTIEAMLAGNVVIGADTGGTLEIIGKDAERGYLYEQGNYVSLADVMKRAMMSGGKNIKMACEAQNYAVQTFDSQKYVSRLVDIYYTAINNSNANSKKKQTQKIVLNKINNRYRLTAAPIMQVDAYLYKIDLKNRNMVGILSRWLENKRRGISIAKVLKSKGINSGAIYGMGILGCQLYDELINENFEVKYFIDRKKINTLGVVKAIKADEEFLQVDAIIVSVIMEETEIKQKIQEKSQIIAYSISEVLEWCEMKGDMED